MYVLPKYRVYFDDELAKTHKPMIYSHECLSGDPTAVYYRIISKVKEDNDVDTKELCIQYFFYWDCQHCMMASHRYDYEPIFIYLIKWLPCRKLL
jgi:hypothetical protein